MEDTIVLYPSPGIGHLAPMVELGKLIVNHQPSFCLIIFITSVPNDSGPAAAYISRVSATNPRITFHHLPTISPPPTFSSHLADLAFELPRLNNPNIQQSLQTISQTSKLKAFIIDFFCNAAFEVSTNLKVPTYYFFTSGASGLSVLLYLPTLHASTINSIKDLETDLGFPGLPPIPTIDLPKIIIDRDSFTYKNFLNTATQMAKSSGIIVNTFESLEPRAVKAISDGLCIPNSPTPPLYCIGPLIAIDDKSGGGGGGGDGHECLTWLNSQPSRSVVFLCFGSMGLFTAEQLTAMATGSENSGHRFLWVVKNRLPAETVEQDLDALLPKDFLDKTKERGLVVKSWAPQAAVLSHNSVGGFVTHCGWNSVLEAVCGGVPMVAWPLYAEQRMNRVFLVKEMKVALALNESKDGFVTADELERRVRELMESDRGKSVRDRVLEMRDGAKAAIGKEGSSRLALEKLTESWRQGPTYEADSVLISPINNV